jgi:hypothetical protein
MTEQNDNMIFEFDFVSPELMDCVEKLRASSLKTVPFEEPDDATPLTEAERSSNIRRECYDRNYPYKFICKIEGTASPGQV